MITKTLLGWIISLIPIIELPASFVSVGQDVYAVISNINHYVPLDALAIIIPIYLTLLLTVIIVSAILQLL